MQIKHVFLVLISTQFVSCRSELEKDGSQLKFNPLSSYLSAVKSACTSGNGKIFAQCISKITRDQLTKYHQPATIIGRAPEIDSAAVQRMVKLANEIAPEFRDEFLNLSPRDVNGYMKLMESVLNKHSSSLNHGTVSRQTLFRIDSRSPDEWYGKTYMSPNPNKLQGVDVLPAIHLHQGGTATWISASGSQQIHPDRLDIESLPVADKVKLVGKGNLDLLEHDYFRPSASICFVNFGSSVYPNLQLCNTIGETQREKFLVFVTNQYIAKDHDAFVPKDIIYPKDWETLVLTFQPDSYRKVVGTAHVVGENVEWTGSYVTPEQPITYQYLDQDTTPTNSHTEKFTSMVNGGQLGRWDATLGKPTPFKMVVAASLCGLQIEKNICCKDLKIR